VAWAGEADITRVEISTDGGSSWSLAELGKDHAKYAWRLWSYAWKPAKSGDYVISLALPIARDASSPTRPSGIERVSLQRLRSGEGLCSGLTPSVSGGCSDLHIEYCGRCVVSERGVARRPVQKRQPLPV